MLEPGLNAFDASTSDLLSSIGGRAFSITLACAAVPTETLLGTYCSATRTKVLVVTGSTSELYEYYYYYIGLHCGMRAYTHGASLSDVFCRSES